MRHRSYENAITRIKQWLRRISYFLFRALGFALGVRLNEVGLNSKCFFKILRLTQPLYEIVHGSDVPNTLIL